jgi:hypothetical protein
MIREVRRIKNPNRKYSFAERARMLRAKVINKAADKSMKVLADSSMKMHSLPTPIKILGLVGAMQASQQVFGDWSALVPAAGLTTVHEYGKNLAYNGGRKLEAKRQYENEVQLAESFGMTPPRKPQRLHSLYKEERKANLVDIVAATGRPHYGPFEGESQDGHEPIDIVSFRCPIDKRDRKFSFQVNYHDETFACSCGCGSAGQKGDFIAKLEDSPEFGEMYEKVGDYLQSLDVHASDFEETGGWALPRIPEIPTHVANMKIRQKARDAEEARIRETDQANWQFNGP